MPDAEPARSVEWRVLHALDHGDERFRRLLECVCDYAIFLLDPLGFVKSWNRGAERITGYKASQVAGMHSSRFYPPEEFSPAQYFAGLERAVKEGNWSEDGWRVRSDGSRFWAHAVISACTDDLGHVVGFGGILEDFTQRKELEAAARELAARRTELQEEERQKLSRDLHDITGPVLSLLLLNLSAVEKGSGGLTEAARSALAECRELARQCSKEIRSVSYLLYPPLLDELGLVHALPWLLDSFAGRTGVDREAEVPDNLGRFPRPLERCAYRFVQECLSNVERHTSSTFAGVRAARSDGQLVVEVSDYGGG